MDRVYFRTDLTEGSTPFKHFWEHTVGSDHASMALRSDWQAQLRRCHDELGFQNVRFHGLLSDDMGLLVNQDRKLLYSFFNADLVVDFLLSIGMRPFVELSFMPKALASGNATVFKYEGNITPPRDYRKWSELITKLVSHWQARYGPAELRKWLFEVWNEPNLKAFWKGTQREYFKLYRYSAEAIKAVDPKLRVGGPATAANAWISDFIDFCNRNNVPLDFITTHHYPTDPLAQVGENTEIQLAAGRRSLLREQAQDARRRCRGLPLYYTEWNTSSNSRDPLHDEPYAAAFIVKTIMEDAGLVDAYGFWTFSDLFEENYFPSLPFHGGFGLLTLHGVPKPAYRAFELLHRLGHQQLLVDGRHPTVDAWVILAGNNLQILLCNYALPQHSMESEWVEVQMAGVPRPSGAQMERIDSAHANPKKTWQAMGSPEYLSSRQIDALYEASRPASEAVRCKYQNGSASIEVRLPPHAVGFITVTFPKNLVHEPANIFL